MKLNIQLYFSLLATLQLMGLIIVWKMWMPLTRPRFHVSEQKCRIIPPGFQRIKNTHFQIRCSQSHFFLNSVCIFCFNNVTSASSEHDIFFKKKFQINCLSETRGKKRSARTKLAFVSVIRCKPTYCALYRCAIISLLATGDQYHTNSSQSQFIFLFTLLKYHNVIISLHYVIFSMMKRVDL